MMLEHLKLSTNAIIDDPILQQLQDICVALSHQFYDAQAIVTNHHYFNSSSEEPKFSIGDYILFSKSNINTTKPAIQQVGL